MLGMYSEDVNGEVVWYCDGISLTHDQYTKFDFLTFPFVKEKFHHSEILSSPFATLKR